MESAQELIDALEAETAETLAFDKITVNYHDINQLLDAGGAGAAEQTPVAKEREPQKFQIQRYSPEKFHGDIIGKIASAFYYVHKDMPVDALANELAKLDSVYACGVVDDDRTVIGIIIRRDLFDTLGKNYGRDVFKYKTIERLSMPVQSFNFEENLFVIAQSLSRDLYGRTVQYYLLTTGENKFAGIFSTKDLLVYLSQITQEDINLATRLQASIVKEEINVDADHFELIGSSAMAKGVGGDFYIAQKYSETNWLFMICDVSGKGIAASLITSIIGGMVSIYNFKDGIKEFVIKLNRYIYNTFESEKFVTAVVTDFNEKTGEMKIYDLGHSLLYLHKNKKLIRLKTSERNLPLGISEHLKPEANKYTLENDEIMILITDGVIEQKNSAGEEYGLKKIPEIINAFKAQGLRKISDALIADIHNFHKNHPQNDDMTFIIFRTK